MQKTLLSLTVITMLGLTTVAAAEAQTFRERIRDRIMSQQQGGIDMQARGSLRDRMQAERRGAVHGQMRPGGQALPKHTSKVSIKVDGVSRDFYVHRPPGASVRPGAVIALHGGGGNAHRFATSTSLPGLAFKEQFLVVFPDAIDGNWNDGRDQFSGKPSDVAFVAAIIDWLAEHEGVDLDRVFATGTSNGGAMAHRLACEAPGLLAGIAPISANLNDALYASCQPASSTPVVMFNGTEDNLMLYDGGTPDIPGRETTGFVLSAEATASFWAGVAGCEGSPRQRDLPDRKDDGTTITILSYPCPDDQVVLYRINGGGHGVPGGPVAKPGFRARLIGTTSQEIDAFAEAVSFFRRYGL